MALQKVIAVQDDDCHWYVIPAWMENEFHMLEELGFEEDDHSEFEATFSKYRTGGDLNLVQLYADFDFSSSSFIKGK